MYSNPDPHSNNHNRLSILVYMTLLNDPIFCVVALIIFFISNFLKTTCTWLIFIIFGVKLLDGLGNVN
jgi:hypothetical protein